jgi:PAS domain S-box-containing protein
VTQKLKILHLEDLSSDAELVERELKKANIQFELLLVENKEEFENALEEFNPEIILSDHSLPSFNSTEALKIIKSRNIKVPFILITATVSEEFAVSIIKEGADDYILKDRLQRLPSAVLNAIEKKRLELKREAAEENLKNSEQRFRQIFENAPEAIIVFDVQTGFISRYNNNALNLLKYAGDELLKQSPYSISPSLQPDGQSSQKKSIRYISEAISGKNPVFEWTVYDSERKELVCEVRLVKLSGADSNQILASFVDISERKHTEKMREKITTDLVHHNKDLQQFAYIISHNLRAPVANIIGLTAMLEEIPLNEEMIKEIIRNLSISAVKLDNVIIDLNHILNVRNAVNEKKVSVRFSEIVEDIKLTIHTMIQQEEVWIKTDFSQANEIFSLKSYVYSIFHNLIYNSIKYKQPALPAIIEIRSFQDRNSIFIIFKDNGLGIDLIKKGDQVFGLYKRFHSHVEGKGMGLFMVKTAVEMLGGTISVASSVNKGTIFTIQFSIA